MSDRTAVAKRLANIDEAEIASLGLRLAFYEARRTGMTMLPIEHATGRIRRVIESLKAAGDQGVLPQALTAHVAAESGTRAWQNAVLMVDHRVICPTIREGLKVLVVDELALVMEAAA